MKKILLFAVAVLLLNQANGQVWFNDANTQPLKLQDVINSYKANAQPYMHHEDEDDRNAKTDEDKDYQFDRWLWYWSQHVDGNGYLVSPEKNYEEWQAYKQKNIASKLSGAASIKAAWTFEGPTTTAGGGEGIGRINVVAFHPTDTNTFWVGSPGGGAWKTTDNGVTWTCMTDQMPVLSVSDIVFNPQNGNTVYLCSGDRDGMDYYSLGVFKSYDAGKTWNKTGLSWNTTNFRLANSMVINPLDSNSLTLASSDGIIRSFNGGTTWKLVQAGNFKQVIYNPADTNILYATTYYSLSGSTFTNSQIFKSIDGGNTWSQVTNFTTTLRITLAVTPQNPAIVKAIASSSVSSETYGLDGVYSSSDTGSTYTEIMSDSSCYRNLLGFYPGGGGDCGGQGFYDLTIAINPLDSNQVFVGGVNSSYSTDGGVTWQVLNQWTNFLPGVQVVHADKHCMRFDPLVPTRFIETNDGGVYITDDILGGLWTDVSNGLGITEFYRVGISDQASYAVGGAQDVGSKQILSPDNAPDRVGGDGFVCHIDYADSTTFYMESEYGQMQRLTVSGSSRDIYSSIAGSPQGGFLTPFQISPVNHNKLIAGFQAVYTSTDKGNLWSRISPVFLSNDVLSVISLTPADSDSTIYAVEAYTDTICYTHNAGATWTKMSYPDPSAVISDIYVDPKNPNHFWATFSGYTSEKISEYDGTSWKDLRGTLPDVPVDCITMDTADGDLYIGTDLGVYYRNPTATDWTAYNTGLPVIRVNHIEIKYSTNELWIATYGRGMWKSPKQDVAPPTSVSIVPFTENALKVYPNPSNGQFTIVASNDNANQKVTVHIIDNVGRIAWSGNGTLNGNSSYQINAAELAKGNYIIEVSNSNSVVGRKQIVVY